MKFHPIADLFPIMGEAELAELAEDIRENGLHEPIALHRDGSILDGRNRYRACKIVGIEPDYEIYTGDDPVGYVISLNLRRRHLNESQRAMVAAKIANLQRGRPAEEADAPLLGEDKSANLPISTPAAAQMLNVSTRAVGTARKVHREAAPNIVSAVEHGEVAVSAAAKAIKTAPREEQETWTAADVRRIAKEVALGGIKLPTPKQAEALSKERGGALIVGSDGKFHVSMSPEQKILKDDWFAFKERLFGWTDFDVTPERALAATPSYQRKNVEDELNAAKHWIDRFSELWRMQNVA